MIYRLIRGYSLRGFSRQEYLGVVAVLQDFPSPGIRTQVSYIASADSLPFEPIEAENRLVIARARGWVDLGVSSNGVGVSGGE